MSENNKLRPGLVHVYTGNGKGKTTAAFGLALRALGHEFRVFMLQFMKGSKHYGEVMAAGKYLPGLTLVQTGLETFVDRENPSAEDIRLARQGLELAKKVIAGKEFDIVILDEINVAIDYKLIPLEEVLDMVRSKPPELELILTGRYAPGEIIELGDIVSNVTMVKEPYSGGVKARKGIEF